MESSTIQQLMGYEGIGWLFHLIGRLVPYFLVITAFTVIYIFVPNTKVTLKAAASGAVVAGILWETVGWAFASFIVSSAKYTAIYSAFATLIFFMIWLYLCWTILLIGASIAFYVQHPENLTLLDRHVLLSNRMKEKIALLVMTEVCRGYYSNQDPMAAPELANRLHLTPEMLQPIVEHLLNNRILIGTDNTPPGLLPAHPPETMTALDVLNVIRSAEEHPNCSYQKLPSVDKIDNYLNQLNSVYQTKFASITLKDLANLNQQHNTRQN